MPTISAVGVGVRHAVARALATANLAPADATFRVESTQVTVDGRQRLVRAEATVTIEAPRPIGDRSPRDLRGLVNPDGAHPLMVRIAAPRPFFLDVIPVTWDRWLRRVDDDTLPPFVDPMCPRVAVDHGDASRFATRVGKRLPTVRELKAAWGTATWPWGDHRDPRRGRVGPPRFDEIPEVGLHPPTYFGLYDLGGWLWQWTAEGTLFGGLEDRRPGASCPPHPSRRPVGFRLAQDG